MACAISWTPVAGPAMSVRDAPAFPIFITQQALAAAGDHCSPSPGRAFGFLTGDLVEGPRTGTPHIVITSTIRSPWPIEDGDPKAAVLRGLAVAEEQARKAGRVVLGWYHGDLLPDGGLPRSDIDAHLALFDRPWHVVLALSLGQGEGEGSKVAAGFFRRSPDPEWWMHCLPFHELLDGPSLLSDGRKVTTLDWRGYRTDDAVIPSDHVARRPKVPPEVPAQPILLFPDEQPARRPVPWGDIARYAAYGIAGVLAALGVFAMYRLFVAAPSPQGRSRAASAVSPQERLDPLADTVALAVAAFDLRGRLFEKRQMGCRDLSLGLVQVEERWTAYNGARKAGPYALDSARDARDRKLYGDVDAVERWFERSSCPRP